MTFLRFVCTHFFNFVKPYLNSFIAIIVICFGLDDCARACFDNSYRNCFTFWSEDLSHTNFFT